MNSHAVRTSASETTIVTLHSAIDTIRVSEMATTSDPSNAANSGDAHSGQATASSSTSVPGNAHEDVKPPKTKNGSLKRSAPTESPAKDDGANDSISKKRKISEGPAVSIVSNGESKRKRRKRKRKQSVTESVVGEKARAVGSAYVVHAPSVKVYSPHHHPLCC